VSKKRALLLLFIAVFVVLAISVPLQYLVRKEVVVGLASDAAHSHAHTLEEGEESHGDEGVEEDGQQHVQEHTEEEHLATEVPLGVNLIANNGFEEGTREQIWGWLSAGTKEGETVYRDDNVAFKGMASAAVSTNGAVVGGAGWLMRLDELPLDHMVIVEGYVRTEGLEGWAYLKITLETREEGQDELLVLGYSYSDTVSGDSDWTLCRTSIYVPVETTGVWLETGMRGRGSAWFDDVSLVVEEAE
jgi:hypothetical protein